MSNPFVAAMDGTTNYVLGWGPFPDGMTFRYGDSVDFKSGYYVTNRYTYMVEYVAIQFVDAMMAMHALQKAIDAKPWATVEPDPHVAGVAPNGDVFH